MKRIVILIAVLFATVGVQAQKKSKSFNPDDGYKFSVTIDGYKDSLLFLGHYYANGTYAMDTARRDKKGTFHFNRKRKIYPGMYFFTSPEGRYVEFIVCNEVPNFTFHTKDNDWTHEMVVKGSPENEVFYQFHRDTYKIYERMDSAKAAIKDDSLYKSFYDSQTEAIDNLKRKIISDYPSSMFAQMMKASEPIKVPTKNEKGEPWSRQERYSYFMEHYWDNMPLDKDFLVRTPKAVFYQPFMDYFDKSLRNAPPEVINEYVDMLVEKARPSRENFRYIIHTITEKYLQSNILTYDAVYVHMVQTYYATGQCFWSSPTTIDDNVKRANTWEKLLVGRVAPELVMKDAAGRVHSLHQMKNSYKLLVFWSPTCGHCKTQIPALYKKYEELKEKYDIGGFAVLSEPDDATRPKWKKFIEDYNLNWINIDGGEANVDWHEVYDVITTPQIFLLNKDNVILGKHLNAELLETIVENIERGKKQVSEEN